jgi:hypothetical protein
MKKTAQSSAQRPRGVTLLAIGHIINAVLTIVAFVGIILFIGAMDEIIGIEGAGPFGGLVGNATEFVAILGISALIISALEIWWAIAFYQLRKGSYTPGLVLGGFLALSLLSGNILSGAIGVATIVYLLQDHVKQLFGR